MPPLEERVEYPYQNIRTRNFPWGDGDKVCLIPNSASRMINELTVATRPSCTYTHPVSITEIGDEETARHKRAEWNEMNC